MTITRINYAPEYRQDEHQRMQQTLADKIDANMAASTAATAAVKASIPSPQAVAPREIDLGFVFQTATTAGSAQPCYKTIILVTSQSVMARYYTETIPFAGNVAALVCDCKTTVASAQTIALFQNGNQVASLNVAANAASGYMNFPTTAIAFNAGDNFYATVTYATSVSSTTTASFIKLWVRTSL